MNRTFFTFLLLFLLVSCTQTNVQEDILETGPGNLLGDNTNEVDEDSNLEAGWQETELKDVNSGNTFKITDFQGRPLGDDKQYFLASNGKIHEEFLSILNR